jgi:hypothetical protein
LALLFKLLAGLCLPACSPLSIGANLLLKRQVGFDGADPLSRPSVKAAAIVLMPLDRGRFDAVGAGPGGG